MLGGAFLEGGAIATTPLAEEDRRQSLASFVQKEVAQLAVTEELYKQCCQFEDAANDSETIPQSLSLRLATAPFAQGGLYLYVD